MIQRFLALALSLILFDVDGAQAAIQLPVQLDGWPEPVLESVDWIACDCELIARIRVKEVSYAETPGPTTMRAHADVLETLKGTASGEISFLVRVDRRIYRRGKWFDHNPKGMEIVVFLDRRQPTLGNPGTADDWEVRRHGPPALDCRLITLPDERGFNHLLTIDGTPIRDVDQLRERIKRAITEASRLPAIRSHRVFTAQASAFVVPITPELEQLAERWLASNDVAARIEGIKAIAHFCSPKNKTLLLGLLSDQMRQQYYLQGHWLPDDFPIRREAVKVLRAWGVDTTNPILETPGDLYHSCGVTAGGTILVLVALIWMTRRKGFPVYVSLALLIALLWMRSFFAIDSFVWPVAGSRLEVVSSHGILQLIRVANWNKHGPLMRLAISPSSGANRSTWDTSRPPVAPTWSRFGIKEGTGTMLTRPGWFMTLPFRWLLALCSIPPAWRVLQRAYRFHRFRRALRRGLCPACGYDLWATPERCPECGLRHAS